MTRTHTTDEVESLGSALVRFVLLRVVLPLVAGAIAYLLTRQGMLALGRDAPTADGVGWLAAFAVAAGAFGSHMVFGEGSNLWGRPTDPSHTPPVSGTGAATFPGVGTGD